MLLLTASHQQSAISQQVVVVSLGLTARFGTYKQDLSSAMQQTFDYQYMGLHTKGIELYTIP